MPLCVNCGIGELTPRDVGGLCVSCNFAVLRGDAEIVHDGDRGPVYRFLPLSPSRPLGSPVRDPGRPYRPQLMFDGARVAERLDRASRAVQFIDCLAWYGVGVRLVRGAVVLDRPGRLPLAVLSDFADLESAVKDVLDADRLYREVRPLLDEAR